MENCECGWIICDNIYIQRFLVAYWLFLQATFDKWWTHVTHAHTHKHQMTTAQLHLWSNRWMNVYEKQMKTAYACTFCDPRQFTAFNWVQHKRLFQSMEKKSATMRWHRRNEFLQLWFNLVNENNRNQRMNTRLKLLGSDQVCIRKKKCCSLSMRKPKLFTLLNCSANFLECKFSVCRQ